MLASDKAWGLTLSADVLLGLHADERGMAWLLAAAVLLGVLTVLVAELGDCCLLYDCGVVDHYASCLEKVLHKVCVR